MGMERRWEPGWCSAPFWIHAEANSKWVNAVVSTIRIASKDTPYWYRYQTHNGDSERYWLWVNLSGSTLSIQLPVVHALSKDFALGLCRGKRVQRPCRTSGPTSYQFHPVGRWPPPGPESLHPRKNYPSWDVSTRWWKSMKTLYIRKVRRNTKEKTGYVYKYKQDGRAGLLWECEFSGPRPNHGFGWAIGRWEF